jgi:small subunit ribosomal protein S1
VPVKVLDIDRERQRISLGLKQTQEDPWQRVMDTYNVGDVLEGKVTKVVSFGAFVEILDGVEGLVHISELAQHHVENPREVVNQGDTVKVRILEIDSERRRLSLSVKRVEDQVLPGRSGGDGSPGAEISGADLSNVPELGLSEDVFSGAEAEAPAEESAVEDAPPPVEETTEPVEDATISDEAPVEGSAPAEEEAAPAEEEPAPAEEEAPPAEDGAAPEGEPAAEQTAPPAE